MFSYATTIRKGLKRYRKLDIQFPLGITEKRFNSLQDYKTEGYKYQKIYRIIRKLWNYQGWLTM